MIYTFCRYFVSYLFTHRQWPLILAALGLFLSSFALIFIQSIMEGFQSNQIRRSKNIEGEAVILISALEDNTAYSIQQKLKDLGVISFLEYEGEFLIKNGNFVKPVIVHGVEQDQDLIPAFLKGISVPKGVTPWVKSVTRFRESILPWVLGHNMNLTADLSFQLISPSHYNHFLGELPRRINLKVDRTIETNVPEIDSFHLWTRLSAVQNLIGQKAINRIRIYGQNDLEQVQLFLKQKYPKTARLQKWEERHKTLVWSLALESTVMLFLFVGMTFLVGLCIVSGLYILYNKVKRDLASFWILGASRKKLERANLYFLNGLSLVSVLSGLLFGLITLYLIDQYGGNIFSEEFVDQKILVDIQWEGILLSFIIPYGMCMLFCWYTLRQLKNETNYLDQVRALGT